MAKRTKRFPMREPVNAVRSRRKRIKVVLSHNIAEHWRLAAFGRQAIVIGPLTSIITPELTALKEAIEALVRGWPK